MVDDRDARIAQLETENADLRRALAETQEQQAATADVLRELAARTPNV